MLNAEFVAVIQVLVYAGAIMVLFLFVLMLLSSKDSEQYVNKWTVGKIAAGLLSIGIFIQIARSIHSKRTAAWIEGGISA